MLDKGSDGSARGGSLRSSDGAVSYNGLEDIGLDGRARIKQKMEQIKEKLSRVSLAREADVEDFLAMTSSLEGGNENPQLTRVRQHFEKKNKKSAQEIDHLQKKLEHLQGKLMELDMGIVVEPSPKAAVLNNLKKTGPLLRDVMSAPRGIAHMIKNTFGSADNIPDTVEGASNVGHSTFYSSSGKKDGYQLDSEEPRPPTSPTRRHKRTETLPAMAFDLKNLRAETEVQHEPQVRFSQEDDFSEIRDEVRELKVQNQTLLEQLNKLQKLEELLNETIELHQAEMIALKSDLNTIATRMDYQYGDRFCSIEESIESTQNKIIRMEANVKEWAELRPQTTFSSVMLSGTNILVEFIKLILFIVSFVLDFVRPFTGTRTRAGFLILLWTAVAITWHIFDIGEVIRNAADTLRINFLKVK